MADASGLDEVCSGLSQDSIENLCNFLMEANLLRVHAGKDAINVDEAMRYIKSAQFSSVKAIEIYKTYQKHRDTYQLDSLRPYREPLCSGIGARKMEVVGTQDSEGSPIVLFTLSRHESLKSEHKTDMQLLFYILDQVAESDIAQENGIVFLIDLRDSVISDTRYASSVLSVLSNGYPMYIKMIYLISTSKITKVITAITKMVKFDSNKLKCVSYTELGSQFLPEQLPLSLGGTYIPKATSPTHPPRRGVIRDDPPHKPVVTTKCSGSGGGSESRESNNSGRSVNQLLGVFENNQGTTTQGTTTQATTTKPQGTTTKPQGTTTQATTTQGTTTKPQGTTTKPQGTTTKPQAPTRPPALNKPTTKPLVSNKPPPNKLVLSVSKNKLIPPKKVTSESQSHPIQVHPLKKLQLESHGSRAKVPLLPPNGRGSSNAGKQNFSPSVESVSQESGGQSPKVVGKLIKPMGGDSSVAVKPHPLGDSSVAVKPHPLGDSSVAVKPHPLGDSSVAVKPHPLGDSVMKRIQNFHASKSLDIDFSSTNTQSSFSTSCNINRSVQEYENRKRADSAGKNMAQPSSAVSVWNEHNSSPNKIRKSRMQIQLLTSSGNKEDDYSMASQRKLVSNYENVDTNSSPPNTQQPPLPVPLMSPLPVPLSPPLPVPLMSPLRDLEYENVEFCNRDSDVYENVGIGFAGTGSDITGPLPPLPLSRKPHPLKQPYENVELTKRPQKMKHGDSNGVIVEEDDDVLFGQEGPPGMQDIIYENFGPDKGNCLMNIEDMSKHVEKLGKNGISTEYYKIRNEPIVGLHKACRLPCNVSKNRYKDVICYDVTRVQLHKHPGRDGSDYIHANYVDGYNKPNAFILTQGPKDKTVVSFWRMIWEKHVLVIVMVTKCVELGKRKCAQYWPESDTAKHGKYTITVTDTKNCDGYNMTTLCLSCKGVERSLVHFQFLAWPDYGIPKNGSSILNLIFAVRDAQSKATHGSINTHPIVVHCSAGVGRSGAFCSIDNCIFEIDEKKETNFQGMVRQMRKQRAYSIQTDEQYEFCYRTIIEYGKSYKH